MDTKINIRESLNKYDLRNNNKYDLRNLYDSCIMDDKEKRIIAEMIYNKVRADVLYEALMNKFEGKSLNEAPDEYGIPYDDELEVEYDSIRKEAEKKIADRKAEVEDQRKKAYQPYYTYEGQQIPSKSSDYIKTIVAAVDIPDGAFQGLFSVEKLIIFPGVKSIGTELFTSSPVRLVYIPDSVESIEKRAFKGIYNATFYCSAKSFAYDYLTKLDLDVDTNVKTLNQMLDESLNESRQFSGAQAFIEFDKQYWKDKKGQDTKEGIRKECRAIQKEFGLSKKEAEDWMLDIFCIDPSVFGRQDESLKESFLPQDKVEVWAELDRKWLPGYEVVKKADPDDLRQYGYNYLNDYNGDKYVVKCTRDGLFLDDIQIELEKNLRKAMFANDHSDESLKEGKSLKEDLQLELVDSKEENEGSFSSQYYQYKIGRYNVEKTIRTREHGRVYQYIEAIPEGESVIGKISYNSIRRDPHFLIESSHAVISDIEGIQKAIADYQEAIQVAEVLERELL